VAGESREDCEDINTLPKLGEKPGSAVRQLSYCLLFQTKRAFPRYVAQRLFYLLASMPRGAIPEHAYCATTPTFRRPVILWGFRPVGLE
jgi:hypothetical protein